MKNQGMCAEFTAAYSPQQNGVSERMNRTLVEAACSMLIHADLSNAYWAEAVATAAYLRNRMVTTALKLVRHYINGGTVRSLICNTFEYLAVWFTFISQKVKERS